MGWFIALLVFMIRVFDIGLVCGWWLMVDCLLCFVFGCSLLVCLWCGFCYFAFVVRYCVWVFVVVIV